MRPGAFLSRALTMGEQADGTCWVGRCSGTRTQKPLRVHPFEGCAFPYFAKHRDSPCLLVKGTDCAGDVLPVWGVVIVAGLEHRIHTDVPRPRSGGGLCVPRGFGGDVLPHIPATRAMFAYPSESASSTVCGGGKTTNGRLVGCI